MSEPRHDRDGLRRGATLGTGATPPPSESAPPSVERLDLKVGSVLAGKYRLERALGFGGMGAVWVARNAMTGGDVALKVLHEEVENPEALERFRREANLAARLSHRGIVRVFDLVELHEGTLVMVMELLRGETLASRLDQHTTVPVDTAVGVTLAIASALSHAHQAGIVHRDLKPENVFLCLEPDGAVEPKILDFGISKVTGPTLTKLTSDGTLLGTPGYMSPEQTRGDPVDARSDIFAMAILLYEMISGANPFYGTSYNAVIAAILEREPEPLPQVSPDVWRVMEKAFSKNRGKRHATAAEFATALRNAAGYAGRTSSPLLDLESMSVGSPSTAQGMAARRASSETPTEAASFLPPQWRTRLIAAGATVTLLGVAGYVHFHAAATEAKEAPATTTLAINPSPAPPGTAPATAATASPSPSSSATTAAANTTAPSANALTVPPPLTPAPAAPLSAKGQRAPTTGRPDGRGNVIVRDPSANDPTPPPPLTPDPVTPDPAAGAGAARAPEVAPTPAPSPAPAPAPPPAAPTPSVKMQTNSGL